MLATAFLAMIQVVSGPVQTPESQFGIGVNAGPVTPPSLVFRPPLAEPEPPEYITEFRERLEQASQSERVVGLAVAVLEQGRPVLVYTSGETAAGSGEPVTENTAFRAASVTKSFTGTLLAMLEHDGLIDLNTDVPTDVIDFRGRNQPTWRQVLSHQTGLPRNAYDNLIEAGRDPGQARARLSEVSLACRIGNCYTYQNVAFSATESLIEEATGLSYRGAVEHYLFAPYGMWTASLGANALQDNESWARPHRGWSRRSDRPGSPESNYDSMPSAAGINVTLNDLIRWAEIHMDTNGGIPEEVRERVWTPYVNSVAETRRLWRYRSRVNRTYYGLGWRIYNWGDRTLVAHAGQLSGYGAQIVMEPETGFAFIALWNADANAPWRLWPTVMDLRTGDGPGNWLDIR